MTLSIPIYINCRISYKDLSFIIFNYYKKIDIIFSSINFFMLCFLTSNLLPLFFIIKKGFTNKNDASTLF